METSRDDLGILLRSAFLKKGTKQKFSLFSLIVISIILITLEKIDAKPLNAARFFIKDGIYRASHLVSIPQNIFSTVSLKISNHLQVLEENENLKKQVSKYKSLAHENKFSQLEFKKLKEAIKERDKFNYAKVTATVLIDTESPFIKSIIINKGRDSELKNGMAVLESSNFVGRIVESNYFSSRVLLLTDLNSKIPVVIEPEGYQAILSGNGTETPILDFLPKDKKIVEGQTVFTSGKDGILFSGLPVGKTIILDNKIAVSLFSNLDQLNFVNVIFDEPLIKENQN